MKSTILKQCNHCGTDIKTFNPDKVLCRTCIKHNRPKIVNNVDITIILGQWDDKVYNTVMSNLNPTLRLTELKNPVIDKIKSELFSRYPNITDFNEILYKFKNAEESKCLMCDGHVDFRGNGTSKTGYRKFCSTACYAKHKRYNNFKSLIDQISLNQNVTLLVDNYDIDKTYQWKHTCGNEYQSEIHSGRYITSCDRCLISDPQAKIVNFIKEHYSGLIISNDRSVLRPKELDVYLPDLKLAIEVDGIYWHQYDVNPQFKKIECLNKGINLLHFNDIDINNNFESIKSIILSKIKCTKKLYARNTIIKEISSLACKNFCDHNHFQRGLYCNIQYGLYHNDELVSVIGISKPRYNKKYQYEIVRLCSKLGHTVVGGASKLFKRFLVDYNNPSVISYANLDYSDGNVYKILGFALDYMSKPSFRYINKSSNGVLSRYQAQKHKLVKILSIFDINKSANDNLVDNKFIRVYDRGTLVFIR